MTAAIPTLAKQYDPFATEPRWQTFWEEQGVYVADPKQPGEAFSMVLPPPQRHRQPAYGACFRLYPA